MTQKEPCRLSWRAAFVMARIRVIGTAMGGRRQAVLPACQMHHGSGFRLGGEIQSSRGIAWVFARRTARTGLFITGAGAIRLPRGAPVGVLRGAATGLLFPRGFSHAAPAHRKSDAEAEEPCCQAGNHVCFDEADAVAFKTRQKWDSRPLHLFPMKKTSSWHASRLLFSDSDLDAMKMAS
jgi:hypothetical protein